MRKLVKVALLIATLGAVAAAQAAPTTIDPGMTKAQVVERLGKPLSEHSSGGWTYLYYRNGQERKFGMSDLVTLENEKVVDAIFRSPQRRYSGQSSSPLPVPAATAVARGHGGATSAMALPPAGRTAEPRKGGDAGKIGITKKKPDNTTKTPPAPAKKP